MYLTMCSSMINKSSNGDLIFWNPSSGLPLRTVVPGSSFTYRDQSHYRKNRHQNLVLSGIEHSATWGISCANPAILWTSDTSLCLSFHFGLHNPNLLTDIPRISFTVVEKLFPGHGGAAAWHGWMDAEKRRGGGGQKELEKEEVVRHFMVQVPRHCHALGHRQHYGLPFRIFIGSSVWACHTLIWSPS